MDTRRLLVVDLEATCWKPEDKPPDFVQEVIEIGYAIVDQRRLEIVKRGQVVVSPTWGEVGPFCTELTGWTAKDLADQGIPFLDACRLLRSMGMHKMPWGSWGDFDRRLFAKQMNMEKNSYMGHWARGLEPVQHPFAYRHVNLKLATALMLGWKKEHGVMTACANLGLEFKGRLHSGSDDAYNIARVWVEAQRRARA